ncbi:hypothetical protein BZA70DRAFT_289190 [Myxozyma melibiosi]|uniref:Uncharacterized protein n=1 Tax=Myxozyma melibiosi TaxID=54550 RepID=A0ABR1F828_9ASCO
MVFGQRGARPSSASHTAAAFYMHRRCRHLPTYAQPRLESAFAGYPTTERGYGRSQPSTCFAAHDDDDLIPEVIQSPVFNVDLSRIRLNDALIFHGLDFVYDNFASRIDKRQHKDQLGTGPSYGFLFLTAYDRALFIKIFNRWSRLRYNSGQLHPFCSIYIHPGTNQKSPILRLLISALSMITLPLEVDGAHAAQVCRPIVARRITICVFRADDDAAISSGLLQKPCNIPAG